MKGILPYIAKRTSGKSFKSHKYCLDDVKMPGVVYDDRQDLTLKKYGETEKIKQTKPLLKKSQQVQKFSKPLFKYFLDGSRRTYKVDDIAYDKRVYPVIAGQIGVGCCERLEDRCLNKKSFKHDLVLALPGCADKDGNKKELFFNKLVNDLNEQDFIKSKNIKFHKVLSYEDREMQVEEKYENLGIAKIHDEMIECEKKTAAQLTHDNLLNENAYLLKDGSLEYQKMKTGDLKDLSVIKSNYKCVVGVSKSFNPEKCRDKNGLTNATKIAELSLFSRTPAYMYESSRTAGKEGIVKFAIWYLRLRDARYTASPYEGIVKIEKILVSEAEQNNGLDSEEIDLISANLINERNPVCYGSDTRWANHLYPVYLTETYIKSKYLDSRYFINLF
ncbi:MAG: hypothetical protein KAW12_03870 [Candidatus Aminicenantes bacterium]|nr:hypothetical protein [Candidatus Aminicenantes bacterium]